MASYTPNLSLIKPAGTDRVAVSQLNENMNILDEAVGDALVELEQVKAQKIPQSIIDAAVDEYLDEHGIEITALTTAEINQAFSEVFT